MPLSAKAREYLTTALTNAPEAKEIADAIDAAGGVTVPQAAHVAPVAAANATDLPSAEALANANKATLNQLLSSLQAAGLMASS